MDENEILNPGSQNQPWPPQPEPKPMFGLKKGDTAFAICAVLVCIFASVFGIFGGFALGYLLSVVFMLVLFAVYFARAGKVSVLPVLCGLLSLANSAVFVCTSNGSVRFFGVILSFLLALMCFGSWVSGRAKGNRQTFGVYYTALATMGNMGVAIKSLFSNSNGDKKAIGKVLIGFICAIPVLFVVVPLLISSDDAFSGMMESIFSDAYNTIFKAIFGLFLSLFVVSYGFSLKTGRITKVKEGKSAGIENVYLISFLAAICMCYGLYLFSQLAYFFSAFRGFLPDGEITYAQYARKGFFEMCIIAVINLGIVFLSLLLAKKTNGKVCHGIKALATFIAVFTLTIIATAISKMVLYINAYGMTQLRLTTSAFMVFLTVVFISVILRIYIKRINIVKTALLAAGCVVLILGVANVNKVCAQYNYESYQAGKLKTIDVSALYDLGDEGIPYIVKLAGGEDKEVAAVAKRCLARACLYDYFDGMKNEGAVTVGMLQRHEKNPGFGYFSIPRARAYDSLYRFVEENPDFGSNPKKYMAP